MALKQTAVKLSIVEEQEIFRKLYKLVLTPAFEIELVADAPDRCDLAGVIASSKPDVLLVGVKSLSKQVIQPIAEMRATQHQTGTIILLMKYDKQDLQQVRRLAACGGGGMAVFLKQSLEQTEQLVYLISAVHQGQVIFDPAFSATLLSKHDECLLLRQMTTREQEILGMLADGYTNSAIARTLLLEVKTVEYYINVMYSKLKSVNDFDAKHARVEAARLYLQAIGELPQTAEAISHSVR